MVQNSRWSVESSYWKRIQAGIKRNDSRRLRLDHNNLKKKLNICSLFWIEKIYVNKYCLYHRLKYVYPAFIIDY